MDIATGSGQQYSEDLSWREDSVQRLLESWQSYYSKTTVGDEKDDAVKEDANKPRAEVRVVASTLAQQDSLKHSIDKRGAPLFSQVWFCFKRAMLQQLRNTGSFFFEVGVGALAGAVIGLSAFSANGQLFKGIYHFPFTALSSAVDYQSAIQIGLLGGLAIGTTTN